MSVYFLFSFFSCLSNFPPLSLLILWSSALLPERFFCSKTSWNFTADSESPVDASFHLHQFIFQQQRQTHLPTSQAVAFTALSTSTKSWTPCPSRHHYQWSRRESDCHQILGCWRRQDCCHRLLGLVLGAVGVSYWVTDSRLLDNRSDLSISQWFWRRLGRVPSSLLRLTCQFFLASLALINLQKRGKQQVSFLKVFNTENWMYTIRDHHSESLTVRDLLRFVNHSPRWGLPKLRVFSTGKVALNSQCGSRQDIWHEALRW